MKLSVFRIQELSIQQKKLLVSNHDLYFKNLLENYNKAFSPEVIIAYYVQDIFLPAGLHNSMFSIIYTYYLIWFFVFC